MRCKINNSTRFNMINRLYTQHKYFFIPFKGTSKTKQTKTTTILILSTFTPTPIYHIANKLLLNHLWSCVLKLISELHDFIWVGIVFHRDAPENEKLFLERFVLGLGRVMNLDVARMLEQIKSCLRYGGAWFLYVLNTNIALLNITFSLSGSSPKYSSFVSLVRENQISSILQLFCEEN